MKNSVKRSLLLRLVALLMLAAPVLSACEKDDTSKAIENRVAEYKVIDDKLIQEYLTRHNITEGPGIGQYQRLDSTTNAGLYLVRLTNGPGTQQIVKGNRAEIKYVGRFLRASNEATVFDNSTEKSIPCGCIPVVVGAGQVIRGWGEALLKMKKGDRKLLLVPSYLAYGPRGNTGIPVDEPLLFDMEVLDVR